MSGYIGVNNVPKNVSEIYINLNGNIKEVIEAYIGIEGVAKKWFEKSGFNPLTDISYTGTQASTWQIAVDSDGNWILYIFTTGTLTLLKSTTIDVFCVGGGGGGMGRYGSSSTYKRGGGGGGGGRCHTLKGYPISSGSYTCTIGAAGTSGYTETNVVQRASTNGGSTSIATSGSATIVSASGGGRASSRTGANGGSGGGGGGSGTTSQAGGAGGSNGGSGKKTYSAGGTGEGQTVTDYATSTDTTLSNTRAFGETGVDKYDGNGYFYAGGGGGGSSSDGANGSTYYCSDKTNLTFKASTALKANTGMGGNGATGDSAGNGSAGLIIIRNAR